MKNTAYRRPQPHEHGAYYNTYISKVERNDVLQVLEDAKISTVEFLKSIPAEKWDYRYAPGKWSVKEVIQHLLDAERIFAYRALRVARQDKTPLPGFDENLYTPASHASNRSPESLIGEFQAVREATLQLFGSLEEEALDEIGTASENPISALATAYILAGHEIHHLGILRERYL